MIRGCIADIWRSPHSFHDTVSQLLDDLQEDPPHLPSWLHVVNDSVPEIVDALSYWSTELSRKSTSGILEYHTKNTSGEFWDDFASSTPMKHAVDAAMDSQRSKIAADIAAMPDATVIQMLEGKAPEPCPGPSRPQERKEWLSVGRALITDLMVQTMAPGGLAGKMSKATDVFAAEKKWYAKMRIFVPPSLLRATYTGFDEIWKELKKPNKSKLPQSDIKKVATSLATVSIEGV